MNTWNRFLLLAFAVAAPAGIGIATANDAAAYDPCGQPPAPTEYSREFLMSQARYYKENVQGSLGLETIYEGIPLKGSASGSRAIEGYDQLSISEAESIIQREHRDKEAAIIQECGYRMCQLRYAGAPTMETTMLAEVCQAFSYGGMAPDAQRQNPLIEFGNENAPASRAIVFDSDAPVKTVHYIKNNLPTPLVLTWHVENNADRAGIDLVTLEKMPIDPSRPPRKPRRLQRLIRIKPYGTFQFVTVARRPDRDVQKPAIVFQVKEYVDVYAKLKYMLVHHEPTHSCQDVTTSFHDYNSRLKTGCYTGRNLGSGTEIRCLYPASGEEITGWSCSLQDGGGVGWTHLLNQFTEGNVLVWWGWSNSSAPDLINCHVNSQTVRKECSVTY